MWLLVVNKVSQKCHKTVTFVV